MTRDLGLVSLSVMVWGIGEGMFFFFQPVFLEKMGASPVMIGTILSVVGIVMALVHIPSGYLADRIGRRPLMWAAWSVAILATLVMALSSSVFWFAVGMVLYGSTAFVSGPLTAYITAARGKFTVTRALSIYSAAFNLGAIVGPNLGGWVGESLGIRQSLLIATGIFLVSLALIFLVSNQPIESLAHGNLGQLRSELLNRRFLPFVLIVFFTMLVMYLPVPFSQNYLTTKGLDLKKVGLLISFRSIGVVVLNLIFGQFSSTIGFLLPNSVCWLLLPCCGKVKISPFLPWHILCWVTS